MVSDACSKVADQDVFFMLHQVIVGQRSGNAAVNSARLVIDVTDFSFRLVYYPNATIVQLDVSSFESRVNDGTGDSKCCHHRNCSHLEPRAFEAVQSIQSKRLWPSKGQSLV